MHLACSIAWTASFVTGENDKKKSSKGWKRHKHDGRWHLRKLQKLFNMRWTFRNVKILSIQTDANAGCLDPTSDRYLKEMKVKNKEKRKQVDDNQRAENEERGIRARGCISYRSTGIASSTQVVTSASSPNPEKTLNFRNHSLRPQAV